MTTEPVKVRRNVRKEKGRKRSAYGSKYETAELSHSSSIFRLFVRMRKVGSTAQEPLRKAIRRTSQRKSAGADWPQQRAETGRNPSQSDHKETEEKNMEKSQLRFMLTAWEKKELRLDSSISHSCLSWACKRQTKRQRKSQTVTIQNEYSFFFQRWLAWLRSALPWSIFSTWQTMPCNEPHLLSKSS